MQPSSPGVEQVILRWHLQRGLVPIPKASSKAQPNRCQPANRHRAHPQAALPQASSKAHLEENIGVYDFELSAGEMAAITGLNRNQFALFDADVLA